MPKPEITFMKSPSMYHTKFQQINAFLDNCKYEVADEKTYYNILKEREDFIYWLKNKNYIQQHFFQFEKF